MRKLKAFALVTVLLLSLGSAWAEDWQPITPPGSPSARQGHSMVTLPDGRVFLFGGKDAQEVLLNDLSKFDSNSWNAIIPNNSPPPARRDHQAWARDDVMYVYGGYGENGVLEDLWSYDSVANTWQQEEISGNRPVARHGHSTTTLADGSVIIVGGVDANGNSLKDCWKLSANNTFTQLQDAPYAYSEHSTEISPDGEWMYVFGKPGSLGIYRISTDRWSLVSGGPPNGPGCCTSRGVNAAQEPVVFIFGGKDINGNESSDVYEYNLYGGELSQRESMPQPVVNGAAAPLNSQQSSMLPNGVLNCIPVADEQPLDLQMLFFGGVTNGVPTNTSLWFSSEGTPPPPPPPVTGKIACDTGTLEQGRFTMYVVRFPKNQEQVDIKLTWEESHAKLYLLALGLPAMGSEFADSTATLRYVLRRLCYFHVITPKVKSRQYKKYGKFKYAEYDTSIEKSFENVQFVLLLVKHCRFSKTAKNIQLEIDKMIDNPSSVSYLFPIGGFKRSFSPRTHAVKLPVEPVRWFFKYPRNANVEEKTESGENFWKWTCIDSSRLRYFSRLAFVKFILP